MQSRTVENRRSLRVGLLALGICCVCSICASAQETPISGVVESIGVFKNGVVVVSERFDVPRAGRYATIAPPAPLHGAFFVESDALVETTASSAEMEIPLADASDIDWRRDFQNRWLRVVLPNETEPRTVRVLPTKAPELNSLSSIELSALSSGYRNVASPTSISQGVLLECENGETIWLANPSSLASVTMAKGDLPATVTRKKERLIFDVKPIENAKSATIRLVYLTRGATWAPQYRIDLKDDKTLEIEQTAILLNEWRDLADVPVELYSGFPQIEYLNTSSPMNPSVSLNAFFSSLNSAGRSDRRFLNGGMAMSQAVVASNSALGGMQSWNNVAASSNDEAAFNEGVDLYAQAVGKKTLAKGDRAAFQVAKESTAYKRVVCWDILDARADKPNDRQQLDSYGRTTSSSTSVGRTFTEPWDALLFDNPFKFPITTGPYSVTSSGRFLGQNTLYWTNSQEEVLAPVTKALSLRAQSLEEERQFNTSPTALPFRETDFDPSLFYEQKLLPQEYRGRAFNIRGVQYRVAVIDATITLFNQRADETTVRLTRRYGGIVLPDSFEGFDVAPTRKRNTSADVAGYRVTNPQEELIWTTTLKPGEKKTLKFSYQKLVY